MTESVSTRGVPGEKPGQARIAALAAATVAGAALIFYGLGSRSPHLDEVMFMDLARSPLREMFGRVARECLPYPPGCHLLIKLGLTFQDSIWGARLPMALFGAASVALIGFLPPLLFDRRGPSLVAAVLFAACPIHVNFAQEAKSYAPLEFFVILTSLLFWKAVKEKRAGLWIAYALSSAAGLFVHYFLAFTLAAQGAYLLLGAVFRDGDCRRSVRPFAAALGCAAVLLAPWAAAAAALADGSRAYDEVPIVAFGVNLYELARQIGFGYVTDPNRPPAVGAASAVVLAGAALGGFVAFRRSAPGGAFLVCLFVVPNALALAALQAGGKMYLIHYAVNTVPVAVVLLAQFVGFAGKSPAAKGIGVAAVLLVFGAGLRYYYATEKQDLNGLKRYLEAGVTDGDPIAMVGPYRLTPYWSGLGWLEGRRVALKEFGAPEALESWRQTREGGRVWFVQVSPNPTRDLEMSASALKNASSEFRVFPGMKSYIFAGRMDGP